MPEQRQINPWLIAVSVMFATFMEVLDTTVVNVSLPHIAGSLSATIDEATWALTSYLVANAIILPMTGWLASTFGRKRLIMAAVIGFTSASFLCGLAPNLASLIVFRIIQGATGGVMQPLSQAVLLEAFPPKDRGKAMGFWGLGIVVAPILGPVLGGWLTDTYSWRWVFYINIPVGMASLIMTQLYIFDPPYLRAKAGRSVDYWGIGMLAVGIGALQYVLDKGQQDDWFASNLILALAVVSAVSLIALIVHELTTKDPIVDLRVFHVRSYSVGVFLMTIVGFVMYGSMVLLPIMLQTLLGYPPMQAGIALAPRGIGSFFMMPLTGMIVGRVDARKLLTLGLFIGGGTMLWLSTHQPERRVLGHLLAAGHPGRRHVAAVRAADDDRDGRHPARADGIRHQPLQPDAQHRRQHRHRRDRDAACAAHAGDGRHLRCQRHRARSDVTVDVQPDARRLHGSGLGRRHRHEPRVCGALRHGDAPGVDRLVRRPVPAAGRRLPGRGAAGAVDEAAARGQRRRRGSALKKLESS